MSLRTGPLRISISAFFRSASAACEIGGSLFRVGVMLGLFLFDLVFQIVISAPERRAASVNSAVRSKVASNSPLLTTLPFSVIVASVRMPLIPSILGACTITEWTARTTPVALTRRPEVSAAGKRGCGDHQTGRD